MVDESFVPATQWPSILYWRLLDFYTPALSWSISSIECTIKSLLYLRFHMFLMKTQEHKNRMLLQIFGFFCDWLSSVYIQCLVTVKCWFFFLSGSWGPITSLPVLWSSAESNERVSFLATFEHLSPFAASFTSHVMGLDMFCKKCFLAVI